MMEEEVRTYSVAQEANANGILVSLPWVQRQANGAVIARLHITSSRHTAGELLLTEQDLTALDPDERPLRTQVRRFWGYTDLKDVTPAHLQTARFDVGFRADIGATRGQCGLSIAIIRTFRAGEGPRAVGGPWLFRFRVADEGEVEAVLRAEAERQEAAQRENAAREAARQEAAQREAAARDAARQERIRQENERLEAARQQRLAALRRAEQPEPAVAEAEPVTQPVAFRAPTPIAAPTPPATPPAVVAEEVPAPEAGPSVSRGRRSGRFGRPDRPARSTALEGLGEPAAGAPESTPDLAREAAAEAILGPAMDAEQAIEATTSPLSSHAGPAGGIAPQPILIAAEEALDTPPPTSPGRPRGRPRGRRTARVEPSDGTEPSGAAGGNEGQPEPNSTT